MMNERDAKWIARGAVPQVEVTLLGDRPTTMMIGETVKRLWIYLKPAGEEIWFCRVKIGGQLYLTPEDAHWRQVCVGAAVRDGVLPRNTP